MMSTRKKIAMFLIWALLCHIAIGVWENHQKLIYKYYWFPILGVLVILICISILELMFQRSTFVASEDASRADEAIEIGRLQVSGGVTISDGMTSQSTLTLDLTAGEYSILVLTQGGDDSAEISSLRIVMRGRKIWEAHHLTDFVIDSGSMIVLIPSNSVTTEPVTSISEVDCFNKKRSCSRALLLKKMGVNQGVRIYPEFGDGSYAIFSLCHQGSNIGLECKFR
jgi:hypothetical protein